MPFPTYTISTETSDGTFSATLFHEQVVTDPAITTPFLAVDQDAGQFTLLFSGVPSVAEQTACGTLVAAHTATADTGNSPVSLVATLTPSTLVGNIDDYAPTGWYTALLIRIDPGGSDRNATGFAAPVPPYNRLIYLWNTGSTNKLVLKPDDAGSVATNRILTPNGADHDLLKDSCAILVYDTTSSKWRVTGNLGIGTLAELNALITDATLDDASDSRPPSGAAGGDLGGTYPNPTVDDGADSTAIHKNIAAEISTIAAKATPVSADLLVIEDSADSNNKKSVQVGNLPAGPPSGTAGGDLGGTYPNPTVDDGADSTAIHKNIAAEISTIAAKATPVSADLLVIEDSADSNNKKSVQVGNLPAGPPSGAAGGDLGGTYPNPTVDDGADGTAIHDDTAGEIAAIADKATPVDADLLLIEDSADANNKKSIQIGNLPAGPPSGTAGGDLGGTYPNPTVDDGADGTAIHDDTAGEIAAIADKAIPVDADLLLIEDSADANSKKSIQIGNLPVGPPSGTAGGDLGGTYPNPTVDDGADGTAIHDDTAGEIAAITAKATPVDADLLVIEDSADANNKKSIQIGNLPAGPPSGTAGGDLGGTYPNPTVDDGADGTAIHDDTAGEIAAITAKATPVDADLLVIEDSADANNKKSIQIGNLPAGPPSGTAGGDLGGTYPNPTVDDGADGTAIHDDTAGEIAAIADKAIPVDADLLLIEDSADANSKKSIQIGNLPVGPPSGAAGGDLGGTYPNPTVDDGADSTAIHKNIAAEISTITAKATPVSADLLVIEDSADSNNKKSVQIGNLPGGPPSGTAGGDLGGTYPNPTVDDGADSTAIHKNIAAEISTIAAKATPVSADLLVIEDSADSNNKKSVQIGNLPGGPPSGTAGGDLGGTYPNPTVDDGADATAIHDDTAGEIAAIALKATPVNTDLLLIEDSAAADVKKSIRIGDLPASPPSGTAGGDLGGTYPNPTVDDGADATAIHDDTAGEIAAVTLKATPVSADLLLIEDSADTDNKKRVTAQSIADLFGVVWTNVNWVDKGGNNTTALPDRADLPYLTISAALATAASGDSVIVRPGVYAESGLTVPTGVSLISEAGFLVTTVGVTAAVSHIITLSDGSYLQGFAILVPSTISLAGVTHTTGTGTVYDLDFQGNGTTGLGDGIYKTGAGKIVGGNIRCSVGGMTNLLHVDAAVLALDNVHVPQSSGTTANVVFTDGTGRFQGQGINVGNTNVTDCIHVAGTSTCIVYSPNWFNVPIGGHLSADGVSVTIIGGRVDATVASLLVDPALTGAGTTLTVSGTTVQPLFSFPSAAITTMALSASFHQEATTGRNAEVRSVGAELTTGFPELGSGLAVGEGSPYSDGQVVLTTDSTASPSSDGGTLTDVSTAAKSKSSSTFSFQGTGAGNSILWCTNRTTGAGAPLKHWGVELNQPTAAVLGGGSFIWEIQTAANTWVEVEVMAVSVEEQFRYASNVFLRASSEETIRIGIDDDTTWASTTISGTLGRWMRVRIASTVTTGPVFERMRLLPSHVSTNAQGQIASKGLAQWRSLLYAIGGTFEEIDGGGTKDATVPVGTGGGATGWSAKLKKGLLNSDGDSVSFQFLIPDGICTAFPLKFNLVYSLDGGSPITVAPDVIFSVLVFGVGGVLISDSAGGITPVARAGTAAEVFTSKAATAITVATDTGAITDRLLTMEFDPYDISAYYEGDALVCRLELDTDGTPAQDLTLWTLAVNGVRFTTGGRL